MCNVEVMVEQPQCASVYEEPVLTSEPPPTRIDIAHLIRDPSNRPQIWEYPVNQQDEIRRAYINLGPYQPLMSEYPMTGEKHPRRFQSHWFKSYPWLEYSEKNTAFCFPSYLFSSKSSGKPGSDTFTVKGFNCWKKVNDGERGHDERPESKNQGNFLEMMELLASYNEQVGALVLGNAPQNAKYTSHQIQKEILHVFARNVQSSIRHEIGDARFCLIIDEARDESRREQMALVIRGQGYDGASTMRVEWNGLQALFINDCPYAYYVHCLAHQLQLALIAAAREISDVHTFFQNLIFIINIVSASCNRNDDLRALQAATIEHLVDIGEIETGKGVNQNVMGITDMLCQALQQKSQDILNAMHLVTSTKTLIQKLRDDGWETLLEEVTSFYKHQDIEVPDMDACFFSVGRSRRKTKSVTVEHHYRVDIFTAIIDQQLQELNNIFNEQAIELLKLSTTLDPRNSYKLFNVEDICLLVDKFYPEDFSDQEKIHLRFQLQHYEVDVDSAYLDSSYFESNY
ncbi:uncharacterized protein LOC18095741 [Populus trichocarpa]|uniref:uncharacterized protein LOC18095741 n=1 Tax=Populus trichocarpa TaxID=3694 RepID=UPI002277F48A|nr:uncharacterized protein LOC18095741 [Populus trichocarpa]